VRRTFEATEESVGKARRFVSRLVSDLPDDLRDAVSLMVSELATNALVHASSGFDVDVERSDAAVTISVTDRGEGAPAVQSPSSSEPHGRGLRIVEALSDEWGATSSTETGKTVWFQMTLHGDATDGPLDQTTGMTKGPNSEGGATDRDVAAGTPSRPDPAIGRTDSPNAWHRNFQGPARNSSAGHRSTDRPCRRDPGHRHRAVAPPARAGGLLTPLPVRPWPIDAVRRGRRTPVQRSMTVSGLPALRPSHLAKQP
jgi:anti-sigma regulatory factor (Ser/Thr protein kinase)